MIAHASAADVPVVFGRYNLLRRVGSGGMAEIWKATAEGPHGFQKVLAIKRVLPALSEDDDFVRMFVEEAKLAATLVHPNVVQVFDFGEIDGEYFLAMEYVPGTNLAQLARRLRSSGTRLPEEVVLALGMETCKGLACAHAKGIVHRDVSPQNLLVSFEGELKVTDFGIAKAATSASRTAAGQLRGKLAYMSPEQVRSAPLDGRSDLFALGVVLHELLTGVRLFGGAASEEVYQRVLGWRGPADRDLEAVSPAAREILTRALAWDRDDRFTSVQELEAALARGVGLDALLDFRGRLSAIVADAVGAEPRVEATDRTASAVTVRSRSPDEVPTASPLRAEEVEDATLPFTSDEGTRTALAESATAASAPLLSHGHPLRAARWQPFVVGLAALGAGAVISGSGVTSMGDAALPATPVAAVSLAVPLASVTSSPRAAKPAATTPTSRPRRTPPTPAPTPGSRAGLHVEAGAATLVWLDFEVVDPTRAVPLTPGAHTLRIADPARSYDVERTFEVEPETTRVEVSVDSATRSLRLSTR